MPHVTTTVVTAPKKFFQGISTLLVQGASSHEAQLLINDLQKKDPEGNRTILSVVLTFWEHGNPELTRNFLQETTPSLYYPLFERIGVRERTYLVRGLLGKFLPALGGLIEQKLVLNIQTEEEVWKEQGWALPVHIPLNRKMRFFLKTCGTTHFTLRVLMWLAARSYKKMARQEKKLYPRREKETRSLSTSYIEHSTLFTRDNLLCLQRASEFEHQADRLRLYDQRLTFEPGVSPEVYFTENNGSSLRIILKRFP